MRKSVDRWRLASATAACALCLPTPAYGQKTTLRSLGTVKPETSSAEDAAGKKKGAQVSPLQKAIHGPVILPQPRVGAAARAGGARAGKAATDAAQQPEAAAAECDWTLLILNEVGAYRLFSYNIPCLGCRITNDLTPATAGILGLSKSPTGPWTDTLTISTDIGFTGSGLSERFYIKGLTAGQTNLHAQNAWSFTDAIWRVEPCACPEIPVVP